MLELYHSEPNTFFLKPLVALHEKQAQFESRWFDAEQLDHFQLNTTRDIEAHLHLEREGPLLRHDDTVISNSFFMLEYIADALPGEPLLPEAPYDIYRAHASGQFLGAHLGSLVPILGCVKYLVPRLPAMDRGKLDARLASIAPAGAPAELAGLAGRHLHAADPGHRARAAEISGGAHRGTARERTLARRPALLHRRHRCLRHVVRVSRPRARTRE